MCVFFFFKSSAWKALFGIGIATYCCVLMAAHTADLIVINFLEVELYLDSSIYDTGKCLKILLATIVVYKVSSELCEPQG